MEFTAPNGTIFKGLHDTGAAVSIIAPRMVDHMREAGIPMRETKCHNATIHGVTGHPVHVQTTLEITLRHHHRTIHGLFFVMPGTAVDLIVGMNIIQTYGISYRPDTKTFEFSHSDDCTPAAVHSASDSSPNTCVKLQCCASALCRANQITPTPCSTDKEWGTAEVITSESHFIQALTAAPVKCFLRKVDGSRVAEGTDAIATIHGFPVAIRTGEGGSF
jgi:hypothetical protein